MELTRRNLLRLGGALGALCTRAIAAPPRPNISVADYGALANGADATAGVRQAIARLPKRGGAVLTFPPGTYRFAERSDVALVLDDIHDLTIDGLGVTLMFAGKTRPFFIQNCTSPLLRGLSIDWSRPPFSQGDVVAVAADARSADIRIDPEFPVDGSETVQAMAIYDRAAHAMAMKGLDASNVVAKVTLAGSQLLRLNFTRRLPLKVGETVVLRHQMYGSNAFFIADCADIRVEDVTIHAAPGMAFLGVNCRNVMFERLTIAPPRGSNRLMSTCADGIHLSDCTGAVDIRNCSMAGMGDDGVNVHSAYLRLVQRVDARTAIVALPGDTPFRRGELPLRGDHLAFSAGGTLEPLGEDELSAAEPGAGAVLHFAHDIPASARVGDLLCDRDNSAKLTVANCRFSDNRARGVLAHSNALIERCQFAHQFEEAILLVETTAAMEGPATDHTIVRNNEIVGSERAGYPSGAIYLGALIQPPGQRGNPTAAIVNHDVQIVDNHIVQSGSNAIQADATDGLTIENNRIEKAGGAAVFLSNVRNAAVINNMCVPPAALRIEATPDGEVDLRGNSGLVRF